MHKKEKKVIEATDKPATIESIAADLRELGVEEGMLLLVHSSLSSLGWVCGGAVAVVLALQEVLGARGTLVMPAHTGDLSDPRAWENPPVPYDWWETIRETMPAYDVQMTPTSHMGAIVEAFRGQDGTERSNHPQLSFCARGPLAREILAGHALDFGLGEESPLARLYDRQGQVLLLGVGHANNTSLHLAEYRAEYRDKRIVRNGAPLKEGDLRRWVEFEDLDIDSGDFERLGSDFEERGLAQTGSVAQGHARLMPQRALVDYAQRWIVENR